MQRNPITEVEKVRQQKAVIRSEVRRLPRHEAQALASDLLRYPPIAICNMQVGWFLQWIHGMRGDWIDEMLDEVGGKFTDQIYHETYSPCYLTNLQRMRLAAIVKDTHRTW